MTRPDYKRRQDGRRLERKAEEAERLIAKKQTAENPASLRPGWYGKEAIADYFGVSISFIEKRMAEGMPHAIIGRRTKFKPAECEPWLVRQGSFERRGERRETSRLALVDQIVAVEGALGDQNLELPEDCATEVRLLLEEARRKVEAERKDP